MKENRALNKVFDSSINHLKQSVLFMDAFTSRILESS